MAVILALMIEPASAHDANVLIGKRWIRDKSVNYGFTPSGAPLQLWRDRTNDGINQWNSQNQAMTFTRVADYSDFDPTVCPPSYQKNGIHRRSRDGRGNVLAVTYTCVFAGTNELYSFQVVYDQDEFWYISNGDASDDTMDLWSVASHELGHATGFGHFGSNESICGNDSGQNTMCPTYYIGTERMRTLATHDIHTFSAAY